MSEIAAYDLLIDTKGLKCPLPLLRTRQTLKGMRSGQVLKVVTAYKTPRMSFASYLKDSSNELLETEEYEDEIHHYIRKK